MAPRTETTATNMIFFMMMLSFYDVRVVVVGDQFCVATRTARESTNDSAELIFRTSLYPHPLITQYPRTEQNRNFETAKDEVPGALAQRSGIEPITAVTAKTCVRIHPIHLTHRRLILT